VQGSWSGACPLSEKFRSLCLKMAFCGVSWMTASKVSVPVIKGGKPVLVWKRERKK